jgi:hypothetical protein
MYRDKDEDHTEPHDYNAEHIAPRNNGDVFGDEESHDVKYIKYS